MALVYKMNTYTKMTPPCEPVCACSYWEAQAVLVQGLCMPGHLTPQPNRRQWSQSQHTSEWLPDFWRNASVTNSIQPHPVMPIFHFQAHTRLDSRFISYCHIQPRVWMYQLLYSQPHVWCISHCISNPMSDVSVTVYPTPCLMYQSLYIQPHV